MSSKLYTILTGVTLGVLIQTDPCFSSGINLHDSLDDTPLTPTSSPFIERQDKALSSNKLKRRLAATQANNPDLQQKFVPFSMQTGQDVLIEPFKKKRGMIGPEMNVPINAEEVSSVAGEKKEAFLKRFNSKIDNPTRALIPQRISVSIPAHLINDIRFDPADTADVQARKLTRLALLISNTEEPIGGLSDKEKKFCVAECYAQAAVQAMQVPIIEEMDSAAKIDLLTSRGQLYLWAARNMPVAKHQLGYYANALARFTEAQAQLGDLDDVTRQIYERILNRDMDNALRGQQEIRLKLLKIFQVGMTALN